MISMLINRFWPPRNPPTPLQKTIARIREVEYLQNQIELNRKAAAVLAVEANEAAARGDLAALNGVNDKLNILTFDTAAKLERMKNL